MNKTVNINLAGTFFHIDENAYQKLQRYLEAIKRSFTDSQGRNEIIADIEARIAELFNERVQNEKQVISIKEVEEVITIMGQPEDYIVDEEIFEDEPKKEYTKSRSHRKLFRDVDNAYVGGVSAGLGHYFGIDALWIRLIWVALFFGGGTGIFVYIILWILMPAAETTSDKLAMSGKPVNITNIEEKVKEGFSNVKDSLDEVADKVKNQDYQKVGNNIKSTSRSFFDALGNIIMFFFKIFAKFIGIILMLVGASVLISLIISLLSLGVADAFHVPGMDFAEVLNSSHLPIWAVSLLTLFAVGIPFFYLFILGLKILVKNIKSLGKLANFTLLGLWITSIILLTVFAAKGAAEFAREGSTTTKTEINITNNDTIFVKMVGNDTYSKHIHRDSDFDIIYDESDNKKIYSSDVRLIVRSTKDSLASVSIEKTARGNSYQSAKERANKIEFNFALEDNQLALNSYYLTDAENKYRDQDVTVILYLPEGTTLFADDNTYSFHRNSTHYRDILDNGFEGHYLKVVQDDLICLDCPKEDSFKVNVDIKDHDSKLKINQDGIEIKDADIKIKVNEDGVLGESESIKTIIDSSGITIKSKNN
ncbi:MAG: PspC domain-containing protein [Flavobacteriaceae bacterium]|nr:PspC domain-containing protein [Flavobacteriaceae bacterium]